MNQYVSNEGIYTERRESADTAGAKVHAAAESVGALCTETLVECMRLLLGKKGRSVRGRNEKEMPWS